MKHLYFGGQERNINRTARAKITLPTGLTLRELEKHFILQTLSEQKGNRTWASEKLGISVRTLRNKLQEYKKADPSIDENGAR